MHHIENAIRQALSKVDINDAISRKRVYKSIWDAQTSALESNIDLDQEGVKRQRSALKQLILKIESEFEKGTFVASPPSSIEEKPRIKEAPEQAVNAPIQEPDSLDIRLSDNDGWQHELPPRKKRKGLKLFFGFILLCLLSLTVIGWSFYNSIIGPVLIASAENKPSTPPVKVIDVVQNDDSEKNGWIEIFNPQDISSLKLINSAQAELINQKDGDFIRVSLKGPDDKIGIKIGSGILSAINGKNVTFDMLVRSGDGNPSEISITCDFGLGANCGRRRFEVPLALDSLLFVSQIDTDNGQEGALFIAGGAKAKQTLVDLYAIRIHDASDEINQ